MTVRLGRLTVTHALKEGLELTIGEATRLGARAIARRLSASRGNTQLRNAFADEWPRDRSSLGRIRVGFARKWGLNDEIRSCTGLDPGTVTRRLKAEASNKFLENAFPEMEDVSVTVVKDEEPGETDGEDGLDSAAAKALKRSHVGDRRASHAREDESLIGEIREIVGLTPRVVRRRLENAHGGMYVRNVFAAEWPLVLTERTFVQSATRTKHDGSRRSQTATLAVSKRSRASGTCQRK